MTATPPPPGYQPPEMGPVTTQFARLDPGPSQTYGVLGARDRRGRRGAARPLVHGPWTGTSTAAVIFTTSTTRSNDAGSLATGPAKLYFSWLGWVLAIVAVVAALIAVAPVIGGPRCGWSPRSWLLPAS